MTTTALAPTGPHYPSHLKDFTECRRRYQLKVIERRKVDEAFSSALTKGNVAHTVLKLCADELRRTPRRHVSDLHTLVEPRLLRAPYPSDLAWRADVEEIVSWVRYGLSYLKDTTIIGAELFLRREYPGDDECEAFTVGARIDLVLLRRDEDGEPYVEVVDYKSGRSGWEDPLAPVMARFVLKTLLRQQLPARTFSRVVYTWLYLAERAPHRLELELDLCLERWDEVKRVVAEIGAEELFPPSPSPYCRFCPYSNGNGCPIGLIEEDDGELW
jgi:hypothetical protein